MVVPLQANTIWIELNFHLIEINLFSSWYSWKIAVLALSNNHSLELNFAINLQSGWYSGMLNYLTFHPYQYIDCSSDILTGKSYRIGVVMVSVLASSAVDRRFEQRLIGSESE